MKRERENVEKYKGLRREIGRLWKLRNMQGVPVAIGALGSAA